MGFTTTIFSTLLIFYLVSIKLIIILVIICRLVYQNNSNYLLLIMTMYLYSASTLIDIITLLNYLDLFILYNVFLRTLRNIKASNTAFIKEQAINSKLVST